MMNKRDERLTNLLEEIKKQEEESFNSFVTTLLEASTIIRELDPIKRTLWLQHVLDEIYDEQEGFCAICGKPMEEKPEVDHKIPFCLGGGNERSNLQLVHQSCNRKKGTQFDPYELLRYLEDRYMNMSRNW